MLTPKLKPEHYFNFLGHYPSKGKLRTVRYRCYGDHPHLHSNAGQGRVQAASVASASTDHMAIYHGNFNFVSRVATGKLKLPKSKGDWIDSREAAIHSLAQERFAEEDAITVLETIAKSKNKNLAEQARGAINEIKARKKADKEDKAASDRSE